MTHWFRVIAGFAGIAASTLLLSGCISSPTYGTDETAGEHLLDGVSSALDLTTDTKNDKIAYQPRPGLVVPSNKDRLAPPQKSLADQKNNPNWVESPEQARQRLVAEADAHSNDNTYRSPLLTAQSNNARLTEAQQQQAYRNARKIQMGADGKRRFLSDPPAEYRQVDTAELNDLGEPEKAKERQRKKEAEAAKQPNSHWWNELFN